MYEAGFYDESGEYHEVVTSYNALGNNTTEEVLVAKTPDSVIDIYGMDSFDSVKINQYTKNKEMMQQVIEAGSERMIDCLNYYLILIKRTKEKSLAYLGWLIN